MSKAVHLTDTMLIARQNTVLEQFFNDAGGGPGFAIAGDTTAVVDGGGVSNATAASANAEASMSADSAVFSYGNGVSAQLRWVVDYTEANTDDAEVYIGMHSATVADTLGDSSAGPPADYSGFGFFKLAGGTTLSIEVANGTAHTTVQLTATNSLTSAAITTGAGTLQEFGVDIIEKTATKADVILLVDGVAVYKITDQDMTSISACRPVAFIKATDTNAETLNTYYCGFVASRS